MRERVYLASPHMTGEELKYIEEAFAANWIAPLGPHVDAFEREFADYLGMGGAAALSSGTAALHLAVKLAGVGPGDEVLCSAMTFSASCNPICYEKGVPVFVDSERDTWNMSPGALKRAVKAHPKAKAVIIAELYGQGAKMEELMPICRESGLIIIEDAAEALGTKHGGVFAGTNGDYNAFSFNGNKIITTSGGGMLVSNDEEALEKARFWATQAREKARWYQHEEIGYNYRLSNVLAGIGRAQLKALEERISQKQAVFDRYKAGFSDIPYIELMPELADDRPNHWLSCITLKEGSPVSPLDIMIRLEGENIDSRPIWKPMQLQPVFKGCAFYTEDGRSASVSEDIFNRGICLPSDTKLSAALQSEIIGIIRDMF